MTKFLRIAGGALILAALGWIAVAAVRRAAPHGVAKPANAKDADGPQGWIMGGVGPATLQDEIARYRFVEDLAWGCGGIFAGGALVALSFRRRQPPV